ncbi:uncharacterized protein LOC144283545 isoform X4 [Canis aureus]
MWGRVHADRSPGLLRTRGPAVYDSGRHGATSTMTGVRLPQDPLEDPGGAVQSHIHLSRGYSERQGAPSRVSAGPVTVQGHRPPGLSAELCQETRRVDKWIKMLKRWDHYLPSEKAGSPVPHAGGLLGERHGQGADVHRHLYPKVVPAVLPRPPGTPDPGPAPCPRGGPSSAPPSEEPGPTLGP